MFMKKSSVPQKTMEELLAGFDVAANLIAAGEDDVAGYGDKLGLAAKPVSSRHYATPVEFFETSVMSVYCRDVARLTEGSYICLCCGKFDWYAAVVVRKMPDGKYAFLYAKDAYYFEALRRLMTLDGTLYREPLYQDIKVVYQCCWTDEDEAVDGSCNTVHVPDWAIDRDVVGYIEVACVKYGEYADCAKQVMLHIYYGMVAEEQKANAIVGRMIKMAAVQAIYEDPFGVDIGHVTTCDVGSGRAYELALEYWKRGLFTERPRFWPEDKKARLVKEFRVEAFGEPRVDPSVFVPMDRPYEEQ